MMAGFPSVSLKVILFLIFYTMYYSRKLCKMIGNGGPVLGR